MVFPDGFGAMMTRGLVRKNVLSQGDRFARFYNPIWSKLGREAEDGPPGTYYWDNHRPLNIYWNYLDQVLVGYDLLDCFPEHRFRILTTIPTLGGERPLLRETDFHWKHVISDHLPLLFDLDLPPEASHA